MIGCIRSPLLASSPGHNASLRCAGLDGAPGIRVVSNDVMIALLPGYFRMPKEGPKR